MSSGVALVGMLALVCAAGSLLLWRRAMLGRERMLAARFVERQVQSASAPVSMPRAAPATQAARPAPTRMVYEAARVWAMFVNLMHRAGVRNPRAFCLVMLGMTFCASSWAAMRAGFLFGIGTAVLVMALMHAWLTWRAQKRHQHITRQLPSFLDGIVRLIVIGHSVPAAFQATLAATEAPLRECLDRALPMLRTGMEIDHALAAVARMYRVRELELVGAVLRVSVKYGGRSDVMLDRMSAFMRDLEQADRELVAMSTETRLSSWVLGLLPVVLGGAVIVTNPRYFNAMWVDPLGRKLVFIAFGLQVLGAWLLYRLAKLRT